MEIVRILSYLWVAFASVWTSFHLVSQGHARYRKDYKHTLFSAPDAWRCIQGGCIGVECIRWEVRCYHVQSLGGLITRCRGIDVVRNKIKAFAQKKVTLPSGRHKIVILDEADRFASSCLCFRGITHSCFFTVWRLEPNKRFVGQWRFIPTLLDLHWHATCPTKLLNPSKAVVQFFDTRNYAMQRFWNDCLRSARRKRCVNTPHCILWFNYIHW